MPGTKTNEMPGTRAVLRHFRMSPYKARQVLDLIRGRDVVRAEEVLRSTPREAARVVAKVLGSAVSNARNNDQLDPEELYVSACFADEGTTLKRWRPRARGRATRIRKRTCHITVIVSRLPEDRLERLRARQADRSAAMRARRVSASRRTGEKGSEAASGTESTQASGPSGPTGETAETSVALDETTDLVETDEGAEAEGTAEADETAEADDTANGVNASESGGDSVQSTGADDAEGTGESD
jgi:large subunit ribosomal protein L22